MGEKYLIGKNVSTDSQTMVDLFLDNYKQSSWGTYINAIRRMQEILDIRDFSKLTYENYCVIKLQISGTNFTCVNSFFIFAYCNDFLLNEDGFENCYWDKIMYKGYYENLKNRSKKKEVQYTPALALENLEKIILFVNQIEDNDFENKRLSFCFYVLFYEGMKATTLLKIDTKDYKFGFIKTLEGDFAVPPEYHSMLEHFRNRTGSKFSTINIYFKALGKKVGIDNLMPKDITSARNQNLIMCPQCGERLLFFADYWRNINGKIVCLDCSEQLISQDEKKNYNIEEIQSIELELVNNKEREDIEHYTKSFEKLREKLVSPKSFEELNKYLEYIGKLGEKFVYEKEKARLLSEGSMYAELVDETPANNHENGFDILSYTLDGKKSL